MSKRLIMKDCGMKKRRMSSENLKVDFPPRRLSYPALLDKNERLT